MNDEDLLSRHGDLGSFIVRVQHRQNSSWQGTLTWMEQDKTVHFRSIWEMIKLVESALNENGSMENSSGSLGPIPMDNCLIFPVFDPCCD